MKKAFAFLASSAALLSSQVVVASEAYIAPAAIWNIQGVITISKAIPLTCNMVIELDGPDDSADTDPSFSHTDIGRSLSGSITLSGGILGLCSSIIIDPISPGDITYTRTSDTSGTFSFNNVFVWTIEPGNCQGTITAQWTQGWPSTFAISGTLPAVSGANCVLNGTLDLVDPVEGDIRAPGDSDHDPHQNI